MPRRLTPEQIDFYWTNGYLAVENLIPADRVAAMRDKIEWLCENWQSDEARAVGAQQEVASGNTGASTVAQTARTVRKFDNLTRHIDLFGDHSRCDEILDVLEDLIATPIVLHTDQALLKPPHVGSAKPPHQDGAYFITEPADALITCWCALDNATIDNGCMHYIPGSHKLGLQDHTVIENTPHKIPPEFRAEAAVAAPVPAGSCIFHHGLTLHMSTPYRTDTWRRTMICHYLCGDARCINPAEGVRPVPVRE